MNGERVRVGESGVKAVYRVEWSESRVSVESGVWNTNTLRAPCEQHYYSSRSTANTPPASTRPSHFTIAVYTSTLRTKTNSANATALPRMQWRQREVGHLAYDNSHICSERPRHILSFTYPHLQYLFSLVDVERKMVFAALLSRLRWWWQIPPSPLFFFGDDSGERQ